MWLTISSEKAIILYVIKILANSKRCESLAADRKNIEKIICNGVYIMGMYDIQFNNEIWNNVDTYVDI